jgi:K+-transporting ATPase ATPase C chain
MLTLLLRQAGAAFRMLVVATVVLGLAYPLAVWAIARLPGLDRPAEGSLLAAPDGTTPNQVWAGSSLIGIDPVPADPAADPWFHSRPSASAQDVLGPGNPSTSGGSNLGGFSDKLLDQIQQRRALIAAREGVAPDHVPPDAVTASGSGVDPQISPAYAQLQVPRVARVTGLPVAEVQHLVILATDPRPLGFLGDPEVNITRLNLAVGGQRAAVSGSGRECESCPSGRCCSAPLRGSAAPAESRAEQAARPPDAWALLTLPEVSPLPDSAGRPMQQP